MPALSVSQQPDWNTNAYVLATTRFLVVIGLAYLFKHLYNLVPSIWGTRSASVAAVVADEIGLANIVPDSPVVVPEAVDMGPGLEANLTLEVRPPPPTYDRQNHTERPWANAGVQYQTSGVSSQSAAAQTIPEHGLGLHNGDHYMEEMDIAVGDARLETTIGSAFDEGVRGTTMRPPPDAILSPHHS